MMITRKRVLEEALEIFMLQQRRFSEGMRNQIPAEGYELAFDGEKEKAEVIRQIMREEGREALPPMRNKEFGFLVCGECGAQLVNVEERIRCKFCHQCGREIRWKK